MPSKITIFRTVVYYLHLTVNRGIAFENNVIFEDATEFVPDFIPIPLSAVEAVSQKLSYYRPINNVVDALFRSQNVASELIQRGLAAKSTDERSSRIASLCWQQILLAWAVHCAIVVTHLYQRYLPPEDHGREVDHTHRV